MPKSIIRSAQSDAITPPSASGEVQSASAPAALRISRERYPHVTPDGMHESVAPGLHINIAVTDKRTFTGCHPRAPRSRARARADRASSGYLDLTVDAVEHPWEDVADDLLDERFLLVRENAETVRLFQLGKSLHDSVVGTGRIAAALRVASRCTS